MRQITINCPEELYRKFKSRCAERGVSMTKVILDRIQEFTNSPSDISGQDHP